VEEAVSPQISRSNLNHTTQIGSGVAQRLPVGNLTSFFFFPLSLSFSL
jgi:hypothetical protein